MLYPCASLSDGPDLKDFFMKFTLISWKSFMVGMVPSLKAPVGLVHVY